MRVLSRRTLVEFWQANPAAEPSLRHWFEVADAAAWQSPLDPVDAIEAAMAANGQGRAELAKLIGQPGATEILARRRALTLPMIRKIAREWHIPERFLTRLYALAPAYPRPTPRSRTA